MGYTGSNPADTPLTLPQLKLLNEVRREGVATRNGRARKTVEILAQRGLITYEFDLVPHAKGNGIDFTYKYTIRPKDAS